MIRCAVLLFRSLHYCTIVAQDCSPTHDKSKCGRGGVDDVFRGEGA